VYQVVDEGNDYPPQEVAEGDTDAPRNLETEGEGKLYDQRLSSVPYLEYAMTRGRTKTLLAAAGNITITHHLVGKFFEPLGNDSDITFFVLPNLRSFDGIIADDTLKDLKAIVDRKNKCLIITPGIKIPFWPEFH